MYPAAISANLGDDQTCGFLGAPINSNVSNYLFEWTKTGGASYTDVNAMMVFVSLGKSTV